MSTLVSPVRESVVLHGVSWETYQQILSEHENNPGKRIFYDEGELEIMVVSARHEGPNDLLRLMVSLVAAEFGIEVYGIGSMTCRREDLQKGFEPDAAYYVGRAGDVEDRDIDLTVDPPPDLIIEVEVTHPAFPHFPLYSAFAVQEVWHYSHKASRVEFYRLEGDTYHETATSLALPKLASEAATIFLKERKRLGHVRWIAHIQNWARQQR